jgi:hypothetical protein
MSLLKCGERKINKIEKVKDYSFLGAELDFSCNITTEKTLSRHLIPLAT